MQGGMEELEGFQALPHQEKETKVWQRCRSGVKRRLALRGMGVWWMPGIPHYFWIHAHVRPFHYNCITKFKTLTFYRTLVSGGIQCDVEECDNQSHYSFTTVRCKIYWLFVSNFCLLQQRRQKTPRLEEEVLEVSRSIRDFMERCSSTSTSRESQMLKMKHQIMFMNLDRMMQELPQERVDELNVKWTMDVYNAVLEERQSWHVMKKIYLIINFYKFF